MKCTHSAAHSLFSHLTERAKKEEKHESGLFKRSGVAVVDRILRSHTHKRHGSEHDCSNCHQDQDRCPQQMIVKGQRGFVTALFNSCVDGRNHHGHFHPEKGDYFGLSSMGGGLPAYGHPLYVKEWAALVYAVKHNDVRHVITLGHEGCGYINGAVSSFYGEIDAEKEDPMLVATLAAGLPVVEETHDLFVRKYHRPPSRQELCTAAEYHNQRVAYKNISAVMAKLCPAHDYTVHGWVEDRQGIIHAVQPDLSFAAITFNKVRIDQHALPANCAQGERELRHRFVTIEPQANTYI